MICIVCVAFVLILFVVTFILGDSFYVLWVIYGGLGFVAILLDFYACNLICILWFSCLYILLDYL